ncbi:MAG TPA: hypothetical protein VMX56_02060 [Anaerolineales bacterium]|nr:hypothetical protein [Anaerolineales bacterium]
MTRKAIFIVLTAIVLTGLLLAACDGASQQVEPSPYGETPQQQAVEESTPVGNTEVPEGETAPTSMLPETAPEDVKPTPRPELSATDPSTVSLASGGPQVLEFFAFW